MLDALLATLGALAVLASIAAKFVQASARTAPGARDGGNQWRAGEFPSQASCGRPLHRRACRRARCRLGTSAVFLNK